MTTEARPTQIRLEVPLPPQSWHPNSRTHWARKRRDALDYALEVKSAINRCQYDHPRWGVRFERARLDLVYVFKAHRRRDADNLIAWAKPLIDLLRGQFLVDDDISHLEIGRVDVLIDPRVDPWLHVFLTEVGIRERQAKQATPPRAADSEVRVE